MARKRAILFWEEKLEIYDHAACLALHSFGPDIFSEPHHVRLAKQLPPRLATLPVQPVFPDCDGVPALPLRPLKVERSLGMHAWGEMVLLGLPLREQLGVPLLLPCVFDEAEALVQSSLPPSL